MRKLFKFLLLLSFLSFSQGVLANFMGSKEFGEFQKLERWKEQFQSDSNDFTADEHLQFNTKKEAFEWVDKHSELIQKSNGLKTFKVVPPDESRYETLDPLVEKMWKGFTKLFPEATSSLNQPPVILIDAKNSAGSDAINAFVLREPGSPRMVHAIFIFQGLIDAVEGKESAIISVLGHELSHSVFKHGLPAYQGKIDNFYSKKESRLGFKAARSQELNGVMSVWLDSAFWAGAITSESLDNLPVPSLGMSLLFKNWQQLRSTNPARDEVSCREAKKSLKVWGQAFSRSSFENKIVINEKISDFDKRSLEVSRSQAECLSKQETGFVELLHQVTGVPIELLEQDPTVGAYKKIFDSHPNKFAGIKSLTKEFRARMLQIESVVNTDELSHFTHEEHADDISALVQMDLGLDPVEGMELFRKIMTPKASEQCEKFLSEDKLPPVGSFVDPHRAPCYRIVHVRDLAKAFKESGKTIQEFAADYMTSSMPELNAN